MSKLYIFVNGVLSSAQIAVQAAHVAESICKEYVNKNEYYDTWSNNHKTMVLLSVKNNKELKEALSVIRQYSSKIDNNIPHQWFIEDEDTLGGLMTSVAVVISEELTEFINSLKGRIYIVTGERDNGTNEITNKLTGEIFEIEKEIVDLAYLIINGRLYR